jgi:predicted alpha/beta superfamily hydrolase
MKIIFLTFTIIVLLSVSGSPQNKITIKVITPGNDTTSGIYITGSNSNFGNWNPSAVKLDKVNDTIWAKTFLFNTGESVAFKFTKGSWNTEALTDSGAVPDNNSLLVQKDTTLVYTIKKWNNVTTLAAENNFKGQITGVVKYIHNMEYKGLKPRDIIVWLPPSYKSDTGKRYPVLYMHDGQNLFDPKTSSFGIDWQLDEAADSLIKAEAIKEIIIVGIYNTPDRSPEYGDTELGRTYMNFIVNTLKPYIDKNYRTLPDRENTATGGSSMGGLISLMLAWEQSETFSKAACLSPAFHIDEIDYIGKVKAGIKKQLKIYIDIGTVDLEARLKPGVDEMVNGLEKLGYKPGTDLYYYLDEGAAHSESAWAKRNWRYLEFLFGK